jgi:hypothetical protein
LFLSFEFIFNFCINSWFPLQPFFLTIINLFPLVIWIFEINKLMLTST